MEGNTTSTPEEKTRHMGRPTEPIGLLTLGLLYLVPLLDLTLPMSSMVSPID